jgi:beta-glucan synthesis-associated protein KRE6
MISPPTILCIVLWTYFVPIPSSLATKINPIEMIDKLTTALTIKRSKDGKDLQLVMSDEFETNDRKFDKGSDKFFESISKPDETNNAMQFCQEYPFFFLPVSLFDLVFFLDNASSHYVTTKDGSLIIRTTAERTSWVEWDDRSKKLVTQTRNYTSGMIQSWNKFCFTGGVLELSIQLPGGHADAGGLTMIPVQ